MHLVLLLRLVHHGRCVGYLQAQKGDAEPQIRRQQHRIGEPVGRAKEREHNRTSVSITPAIGIVGNDRLDVANIAHAAITR